MCVVWVCLVAVSAETWSDPRLAPSTHSWDESQNVSVCNSITYASVWNYYIRHHMKGRTKYIIYASAMKSLKYIKNHFVVEGDQENEKKGNEI